MTLDTAYFAKVYATSDDPWGFRTRWYESRKRAVTLASLPRQRYARGYEPGCSNGMLTVDLAPRCDSLLATDADPTAVAAARRLLADSPCVDVRQEFVPSQWPTGAFDLIVLSELAYYFDMATLHVAIDKVRQSLAVDGTLLLCHWRHPVADYPLGGDAVHAAFAQRIGRTRLVHHVEDNFVLDVWCGDPRSVATVEGLT